MKKSDLLVWVILSIPAVVMMARLAQGEWPAELLHGSGEMSARLIVLALMLTPLRLLWPTLGWLHWLSARRRHLGVGAFVYALLHTIFYVLDMQTLHNILAEMGIFSIWTGWLALLILLPLALTSFAAAVRRLGARWKALHRWVYAAALLTLLHWMFVHDNPGAALLHFVPLIGLEIYRVWHWYRNTRLAT